MEKINDLEKSINKILGNKEKIFVGILNKIKEDELNEKLRILILILLSRKDNYGLKIVDEIELLLKNKLKNREGIIYPILHWLEEKKYITSYWKDSDGEKKYYKINNLGKKYLKEKDEIVNYLRVDNEFIYGEKFSWN